MIRRNRRRRRMFVPLPNVVNYFQKLLIYGYNLAFSQTITIKFCTMKAVISKDATTGKEVLTITMPFNSKGTLSKSEKSLVLASSNGNQPISINNEVVKIGINVFKPV